MVRCAYYISLTILLLARIPWASDDDRYRILKLSYSPHCTTQVAKDIYSSKSITAESDEPGTNDIVARIRNNAGDYCINHGVFTSRAFTSAGAMVAFKLPSWLRPSRVSHTRFYARVPDNPSDDIPVIFYDQSYLYARDIFSLHYFYNGSWYSLAGKGAMPNGTLVIGSEPVGAAILIDGVQYAGKTPASLSGIPAGLHTVEAHLDKYYFARRMVTVSEDSTIRLSFTLLSNMDTIFIQEGSNKGILILSQQPLDIPFAIDTDIVSTLTIKLDAGNHRIRWDGRGEYRSLDTVLSIAPGRVSYLDFVSEKLSGGISINVFPPDAQVFLDDSLIGTGHIILTLPVDVYAVRAIRKGYAVQEQEIGLFADSIITLSLNLPKQPDSDGDGFLDSLDKCPQDYGLYDGCPRPEIKTAAMIKLKELYDEMMRDPLTIGWVLGGYLHKVSMKKRFRDLLSNYEGSALNNYRGLVMGNTVSASYKGFHVSLELGQWFGQLKYRRSDTLSLDAGADKYLVYLDTFAVDGPNEPMLYIPSTALALGLHLPVKWINAVYSVGYQWENIVLDDLRKASTGARTQVRFSNNWWFHEIRAEADFKVEEKTVPAIYFDLKIPFGHPRYTNWVSIQGGIMIKFIHTFDR
jgi:hypothetical protein